MKILFFIRSLNAGGAERQLVVTAKGLAERGHQVTVLTFYAGGFYTDELNDTKVQLLSLHKKNRWDLRAFIFRLVKVLRKQSPDVIYSFLGTANILAVLIRPLIPAARIVWGVRASNMDLEKYDWLSRWSYSVECRLARFSDLIIANSHAGLQYAVAHGFPEKKLMVIPNGIDTDHFRPDRSAGVRLRKEWGVAESEFLIGLVGRIDPMKDLPTFFAAAVLIKQQYSQVRFVCVGTGAAMYEKTMHQLATKLGLDDVLIWAGRHTDMVAVYNAFDIASSSSYGEGFPNVIGEAMACGVPCVVTDVGDSAMIVGDTARVVAVGDSKMLAQAISTTLQRKSEVDWAEISRNRIEENFSLKQLVDHTGHCLDVFYDVD